MQPSPSSHPPWSFSIANSAYTHSVTGRRCCAVADSLSSSPVPVSPIAGRMTLDGQVGRDESSCSDGYEYLPVRRDSLQRLHAAVVESKIRALD